MHLQLIDCETDFSYIKEVRSRTLEAIGLSPETPSANPLHYAVYLGLYIDGRSRPAGLAEAYFLDQAFPNYDGCPYRPDCLSKLCEFNSMAHIRTIYVDPEYRRTRPFYLYLYLAMCRIFSELGARYAAMATSPDDPVLLRLYAKTGGKMLGHTSVPLIKDCQLALYAFELKALLRHPRLPRILSRLKVDFEKLKETRSRAAPQIAARLPDSAQN
jgi:hypothetical protein